MQLYSLKWNLYQRGNSNSVIDKTDICQINRNFLKLKSILSSLQKNLI